MGEASEGTMATLYESIVERFGDVIVVMELDSTVLYVNEAFHAMTGWRPEQFLGRSGLDLLHVDDRDRAARDIALQAEQGALPGWTTYRVRCADGSLLRMQLTTGEVTDGSRRLMVVSSRPSDTSTDDILYGLMRGSSPSDALQPVCELFNWRPHGSRVGISWVDHGQLCHVGTGLPAELAGADDSSDSPWAACRRDGLRRTSADLSTLGDTRRNLADELGLAAYWIEPVIDEGLVSALITVWTRVGGPLPEHHTQGMSVAKDYVELIVRWYRQARMLEEAAHRDALTELANRKAFFDEYRTDEGGAVLYCDLDGFKAVNDDLGHRAGDELLRAVAGRIQGAVRAGDVVARIGGDEFAVRCAGASSDQAAELAARICAAVSEPYRIGGAIAHVGISIGVAHTAGKLDDDVLEAADQALYRAKAQTGSAVRWSS